MDNTLCPRSEVSPRTFEPVVRVTLSSVLITTRLSSLGRSPGVPVTPTRYKNKQKQKTK